MKNEFIGVVDPFVLFSGDEVSLTPLKQQALIFDRLAMPNFIRSCSNKKITPEVARVSGEIQWLLEKGIVFEPQIEEDSNPTSQEYDEALEDSVRHVFGMIGVMIGRELDYDKMLQSVSDDGDDDGLNDDEIEDLIEKIKQLPKRDRVKTAMESPAFLSHAKLMTLHQTRIFSIRMREIQGFDAHPVLANTIPTATGSQASKSDVIRVVLNSLPVPDDSTPWEQILEFRSDPNSRNKFLDLRNWMNEVSRAKLSPTEVEQKLEYLINRYQRYMELHKIKTNTGTLETIITTGAEVLGDVVSFKWGKAAQALFALKRRQVALLEGELSAPGNEVAYIVQAKETFTT